MQEGSRPAALARVPPNNLRAEESVLGAMLLSREAIAEVVEVLEPDHFYKPAHGHLYDAILSLYSGGEPVDAVTVADELKRAGLLDEVGGPAVLLDFQATTPAISNAAHYAKIVEEHALLRRMIVVSNEIAETAYGVPDDVAKAVDDAEARMFDVAQRRVANTMAPIKELLPANLDRIEMLYDRGESITGLSTGYLDLDEKLAGLQPSALYVVGARPAMGKALALDTALPTPDGWTTMGEVEVGDRVFDEQGCPTTVTYKSPVQLDRDCYEVVFDDGSVIVADGEHRWLTWDDRCTRPATRTTGDIAATLRVGEDQRPHHRVPVAAPLDCPDAELPLDPYLLGRWLGAPPGRTSAAVGGCVAALGHQLDGLGLGGGATHIPPGYLRASGPQRLALLRGLVDTGGDVVGGQSCRLTVPNEQLVRDARELALSLGCKAGPVVRRRTTAGTDAWRFDVTALDPVFRPADEAETRPVVAGQDGATRWRTIVDVRAVPTRPVQCITVDAPSHLYLAGREMIPTHNTAFALGLAANSAMKDGRPVLIFTLEMSQLELSQRLLCSEALVDAGRVKTGRLEEGEWNRISHAVGRLAEAPIYIDDNPHTSVMDIRAKARRLKSREGDLGMVVVDYVQLMTGRSSAESRQVEVSEISRNLKILARELEAPVVALAQLNRSLEQRTDKRPMLSDLRESGCMPATTRVLLADGSEVTMGELLESGATPDVVAVDDRRRVVHRRLLRTFSSGTRPVHRLRLASGRQVEATGNHRFLTSGGWRPLDELVVGDAVATPRRLPEPPAPTSWPDDEVVLLAHLIGCGSVADQVTYTSGDRANLDAVRKAVRHFGCEAVTDGATPAAVTLRVPSPESAIPGRPHPIRTWLDTFGLGGCGPQPAIPEDVHRLGRRQVALFLRHLWSTRGSIAVTEPPCGGRLGCSFTATSEGVALGVQRLLLRFAITSTVARAEPTGRRPGWHVVVPAGQDRRRFASFVGGHGRGPAPAPPAPGSPGDRGLDPASGLVPPAPVEPEDDDGVVGDGDVAWDRITGIEPLGRQPVFDVTVEEVHDFVANGIVAHNSLEQDADVVLFLYRDEIYDENSPDKGVAEIIIAKHRNGPTGRARLAFRGQYTRFDNMARSVPPGSGPSRPDRGGIDSVEF